MKKLWLAPSILSANFAQLGKDIEDVLKAGSDMIHFDVMDNHYVSNLTIGPVVLKSLRNYQIKSIIDVHLMVTDVHNLIVEFSKLEVDIITFHPESTNHVDRTIQLIKDLGCKVGLAINPSTPLNILDYVLEKIDLVLLMSVNPGFSGQKFIPYILKKINQVRRLIDSSGKNILLEVDGGITVDNISSIAHAGADVFVIGSAIFNSSNYNLTIKNFRKQLMNI